MSDLYPLKLAPRLVPKPWGRRDLSPFYDVQTEPIGEAWFHFEENIAINGLLRGESIAGLMARYGKRLMGSSWEPLLLQRRSAGDRREASESRPYFPILTKLLFTEESLSVQVHPDDEYALEKTGGAGKTEMWYVVDAQPGARVALGLTEPLVGKALAAAALSGEIENYLNWIPVQAGDTLFVEAGLVHALDAGLTICEIQQNSDITYRFYDWGRTDSAGKPRELHIEDAVACIRHDLQAEAGRSQGRLAENPYFVTDRLIWSSDLAYDPDPEHVQLLIVTKGEGRICGEPYRQGDAYLIPADSNGFRVEPTQATTVIRSYRR